MHELRGSTSSGVPRLIHGLGCLIVSSLLWPASIVSADPYITNSKHDLSYMGPGPVRAVEETEICIFCHTPHNASPAAPLWNRYNPTTYYRIYRSPTLQARMDQPGPESKLCLSCHDGSIALGLTLDRPITDPIPMSHMYMPTGPSDLTNDLSDDHPIGFRYDRALSNRDPQLRQPELVDHRIKLGPRGEVECTACHDPHNNELGNFLRLPEFDGKICTTCHDMRGWELGAHALSPLTVPMTVSLGEQLPYRSLAENACRSCHLPHSAPRREYLLYARPYDLCITCHDGLSGPNILAVAGQRYGHHTSRLVERPRRVFQRGRTVPFVECTDCHNPHAAAKDLLEGPLNLIGEGPIVPPPMYEVPGVNIVGLPVPRAQFYYEVCFRCHGDFPVVVRDRIVRQVDNLGNIRREFLPTAASAHPVAFPARNTGDVPSLVPLMRVRAFINCQDCHNNPDALDAGGLGVNGPHGSRFQFLLVAQYDTADRTIESAQTYALCYRCHDRNSILGDQSFSRHRVHIVRDQVPCSACHAPHGVNGSSSQHADLINFDVSIVGGQRFYNKTGRFAGACTLTCHGVNHVNFTYQQ
ncbi:MAG TPA: cytochrome c3 family protein [Phycisphaerae bacterium]|nr:cytochrome c3 family protein [Phycisphaerae bacterium]